MRAQTITTQARVGGRGPMSAESFPAAVALTLDVELLAAAPSAATCGARVTTSGSLLREAVAFQWIRFDQPGKVLFRYKG